MKTAFRMSGVAIGLADRTVAQEDMTMTYLHEIPDNPNATPGFQGHGTIQYSPTAAGGVYALVSVTTNTHPIPSIGSW